MALHQGLGGAEASGIVVARRRVVVWCAWWTLANGALGAFLGLAACRFAVDALPYTSLVYGAVQALLLRGHVREDRALFLLRWTVATGLGVGLSQLMAIVGMFAAAGASVGPYSLGSVAGGVLGGAAIGLFQWLALATIDRQGWLWALATAVCGVAAGPALHTATFTLCPSPQSHAHWQAAAMVGGCGLLYGVLTSMALARDAREGTGGGGAARPDGASRP